MLIALSVRDIVLIDRLDLDFEAGLSALTGETGAGKSILLDALMLALGGRGDQSLVRKGSQSGQVSAIFSLLAEHPARQLLRENDVVDEDDLILRRIQFNDGRTRAFINDQTVSAQFLKKLGSLLVEIHGQHDDRALVDIKIHRKLLDVFGGYDAGVKNVADTYQHLSKIQVELKDHEARLARAVKDEAFARFAVDELLQLAAEAGEEQVLADRRRNLMALEKAADEIQDADEILSGPSSPSSALTSLLRRLQRKGEEEVGVFLPLIEGLDASLVALDQTYDAMESIKRDMDFDPNELNNAEERLFALRAMARKHHVNCDDLGTVLAKYQGELAALESGNDELLRLREEVAKAEKAYREAADKISTQRKATGQVLEKAMVTELPDLKLGAARFIVDHQVDVERISADGYDHISFYVQTNPGTEAGPMLKVASGGELSRFLLALKVVLAERASAPVLIFDEIDTGVGGAVADAMGRRLERLARSVQVLSVTHAPQVAARAGTHMLIEKQVTGEGDAVRTHVRSLDKGERGEEIARMLAGAQVSDEARAAAKRLLSEVG